MQAVITADIVNSTKLKPADFQSLVADVEQLYSTSGVVQFYRGDSFQAVVTNGTDAYKNMLLSRLKAISYSTTAERIDIRLSISIGKVNVDIKDIGSHVEEVFINSGRRFDQFNNSESGRLLLISCDNEHYNLSYELIARYTDSLLSMVTAKQAMALYHLFSGKSQKETAGLMKKSGSTINQQVKTARFDELEVLLSKFETLTKSIADGK